MVSFRLSYIKIHFEQVVIGRYILRSANQLFPSVGELFVVHLVLTTKCNI